MNNSLIYVLGSNVLEGIDNRINELNQKLIANSSKFDQQMQKLYSKMDRLSSNVNITRIILTDSTPIRVLESCTINWDFTANNKGIEGLEFITHQGSGHSYLLGLCEVNDCDPKSTSNNNGRILVREKKEATKTRKENCFKEIYTIIKTFSVICSWDPVGTLVIPSAVHFDDYSSSSMYHRKENELPTHVAVTSQVMSQVWVDMIEEINQAPFFSLSPLNNNTIYALPRTHIVTSECGIRYGNIEGVAWQGRNELIFVSDQAKNDQGTQCIEKEQSMHYFFLP
ncbi:unnamed protein product [Rotaria socialis]|uniref:Uncharacterized protein n=1 Tax=Rotaria socialis TaxID=392032 RepID=A0A818CW79_9BILA|nr:unnamed protein product [Rotaria socialis]